MPLENVYPWAKLAPFFGERTHWLSLEAHCLDVAMVFRGLIDHPVVRARLSAAAGRELSPVDIDRLCVLAFLHDFGKLNHGFQSRFDPRERGVGHIKPVGTVGLRAGAGADAVFEELQALAPWFAEGGFYDALACILSHHGAPVDPSFDADRFSLQGREAEGRWNDLAGMSPVAGFGNLLQVAKRAFPGCDADALPLPTAPAFWHLVSGLLMLADWLASNQRNFPLNPISDTSRLRSPDFHERVPGLLEAIGWSNPSEPICLDPTKLVDQRSLRPLQKAVDRPDGLTVVVESETGSGKTEAALLRWMHLREEGLVDSLYFALPTRSAAVEIHSRVRAFVQRYLGSKASESALLAVPGYNREFRWPTPAMPTPEGAVPAESFDDDVVWAAQAPKRFLAAAVAVGTVDQAMLGILKAKHAHMRLAMLSRSLLVVDEVHASDAYMGAVIERLLAAHRKIGGHSVLLSATLGAAARARLLGTEDNGSESAAVAVPYPSVSWMRDGGVRTVAVEATGYDKDVELQALPLLESPDEIASRAAGYAAQGAKVLVIRNTVASAVAVAQALPLGIAFECLGVPAIHHGRFGTEDRRRLDHAVIGTIGKDRDGGGCVVVGTQTLEQSLDIDADVLLTDLCPIDVLLQRIGRLHRHVHLRPPGFGLPRVEVFVPTRLDDYLTGSRHGLGLTVANGTARGVYRDLFVCSLTLDRITEGRWSIPRDNRRLVETCLHPQAWRSRADSLAGEKGWKGHRDDLIRHGLRSVKGAGDWSWVIDEPMAPWTVDEGHVVTRIGGDDRRVALPREALGPFGLHPGVLTIPGHLVNGVPIEERVEGFVQGNGTLTFSFGQRFFVYDRFGLRRAANA